MCTLLIAIAATLAVADDELIQSVNQWHQNWDRAVLNSGVKRQRLSVVVKVKDVHVQDQKQRLYYVVVDEIQGLAGLEEPALIKQRILLKLSNRQIEQVVPGAKIKLSGVVAIQEGDDPGGKGGAIGVGDELGDPFASLFTILADKDASQTWTVYLRNPSIQIVDDESDDALQTEEGIKPPTGSVIR